MQEELRILNAQDKVRRDSFTAAHGGYQATPLHEHDTDSSAMKRLKSLLKPFYDKYDVNGNGTLDIEELHAVFKDLNEDVRQKDLAHLFEEFDTDKDQLIDFDEFVLGVAKLRCMLHDSKNNTSDTNTSAYSETGVLYVRLHHASCCATAETTITRPLTQQYVTEKNPAAVAAPVGETPNLDKLEDAGTDHAGTEKGEEQNDDEDEHEEVPEDLQHLSPEEQQHKIKMRSYTMMAIGTATVLIFSDPMVGVLSETVAETTVTETTAVSQLTACQKRGYIQCAGNVYPIPAAKCHHSSPVIITIAFEINCTYTVATLSTTQQPPTTAVTAVAAFTSPHLCRNTAQLHMTYIH
eukprot:15784-Heterococcus_DN1.PRE.4